MLSAETFDSIVREGALLPAGMPRFTMVTPADAEDLRQYIRSRADQTIQSRRWCPLEFADPPKVIDLDQHNLHFDAPRVEFWTAELSPT